MNVEAKRKELEKDFKKGCDAFATGKRHELSAILKSIRKRKKKKPEDIADAANMTLNRVESVESGDSNFTIDSLVNYAKGIDLTFNVDGRNIIQFAEDYIKQRLGEKLQEYRESRHISLNSIAFQSKSTWRQFNYIEIGKGNYRINTLIEYLNALGLLDTVFSELKKMK